ncbi:phage tail protein [Achromobacter xylosoxidans]|uniref:phage tail protein n=1 Tax=Alcaligenes xylosoxydans xylosoxydans TaxID=85698 RepID=UPI000A7FA930|nr:phage tail protein [Achromobacter xylosoxidans]
MQELEQIPIGQQANDKTGDPLRNGMAKVNANFTKVQAGVDAVELTATSAAQTATEAKTTADAAIPAAQKGMAGGVAPLDASGKVPATHLEDYALAEEKGAAGGFAPLDAGAKVPMANLPAGTAGGVAPLDASGKVPAVNLPAAEDSIPLSQKGQPGGVATLDSGGKVPAGQLPAPAHGQCRFVYVSATECRLMPYNGNGLIINGRQYRIPAGGISLPIGAAVGASGSANYVYAKDDGSGGISLEGVTTGHARHSDGVEIKSGDPTRTLVGMAFKNASGQFQFDGVVPGVASWFNRYSNIGRGSAYLAGTASASPVSVAPAVNTWVWAGEAVEFGTAGVISSDTAGIAPTLTIFLDGVAENASYGTIPVANGAIPAGMYAVKGGLAEGFHYIDPRLSSGGSGTAYLTCGYFVSNKR